MGRDVITSLELFLFIVSCASICFNAYFFLQWKDEQAVAREQRAERYALEKTEARLYREVFELKTRLEPFKGYAPEEKTT